MTSPACCCSTRARSSRCSRRDKDKVEALYKKIRHRPASTRTRTSCFAPKSKSARSRSGSMGYMRTASISDGSGGVFISFCKVDIGARKKQTAKQPERHCSHSKKGAGAPDRTFLHQIRHSGQIALVLASRLDFNASPVALTEVIISGRWTMPTKKVAAPTKSEILNHIAMRPACREKKSVPFWIR